jgi:hypothetical protein
MDPAIRSGQLRLTCSGLTRSRCRFRIDREALVTASSRTGASRRLEVTDHPRLVGWSSLHPAHRQSLTPLCRRSGTASPVPGPTGSFARRPSCDERLAFTRATETVTLPHLAELQERRSGRLPPCRDRPEFPPAAVPHVPPGLEASCDPRTVLASRPPPCASARRSESPWASAASSIRLAVPRASRRAMRRTGFCHLTSSYEHPCLAGSRVVERLRARHRRSRLLHGSTSRFGGSHVAPLRDFTASGVVFPSRCVRTEPLTPLSPPARSPWSSRSLRSRAGRRDRLSPPA